MSRICDIYSSEINEHNTANKDPLMTSGLSNCIGTI